MLITGLQSVDQVTDDQIKYFAAYAGTLSMQNDFVIQNFADSIMTSPDARAVLQSENSVKLLERELPTEASYDIFNPAAEGTEMFALSLPQENSIFTGMWPQITDLYGWLRRKVKSVFCKIASLLEKDNELDLQKIIKQVLIALVPVLAASTGLMPIALPIVISLAAMLLKYGISKVCPV